MSTRAPNGPEPDDDEDDITAFVSRTVQRGARTGAPPLDARPPGGPAPTAPAVPAAHEDGEDATTTFVPPPIHLVWDAWGMTDTGKVRRINEDALMVHPRACLWVVADGMGGHSKGDLASGGIARAFGDLEVPDKLSDCADLVESTLIDLNARFRQLADFGRSGTTIGSTVTVLVAWHAYVLLLWVGDSRIYRSRRGQLEQLSQDHSQVEEMIAHGLLQRQDAESHPAANVVTRAVGAADELYVDMDYRDVEVGDRFLLCSDGLTKELPEAEIAAILAQDGNAQAICRQLIERALASGARDNVTVLVAAAHSEQGLS